MSVIKPVPVEMETHLRLVASGRPALPMRATLGYDHDDPYAVTVRFHGTAVVVAPARPWRFARELLAVGLDEPAGYGDVRVWPWPTARGQQVALSLSSPDGNALFEAKRSTVQRFLRRTYVAVPRGEEADHLDWDATIGKLLERGQRPR